MNSFLRLELFLLNIKLMFFSKFFCLHVLQSPQLTNVHLVACDMQHVIYYRMGWQERMNGKVNVNKPSYNTISSRCIVF